MSHPDIHFIEPAAVAPVLLRVGRGSSKTLIVFEAVWNRGVTVAADEARNEGGAPQHVRDRTDVEAGQARSSARAFSTPARTSAVLHGQSRIQLVCPVQFSL